MSRELVRCFWTGNDPQMIQYHDEEWGVPLHEDRKLFEYMVLDSFQSGLSWQIILHKRAGFDSAFRHFDPGVIVTYGQNDIERLLQDERIVRNRRKLEATIINAQLVLDIQKEYGSLDTYLWQFVQGRTIHHNHQTSDDIEANSKESDLMSKDLRKRGFKFFGPTVCYAFMQGAGMVNDHLVGCFRWQELGGGK
jgi:DNA-3-methyladenine glycosylase I